MSIVLKLNNMCGNDPQCVFNYLSFLEKVTLFFMTFPQGLKTFIAFFEAFMMVSAKK